MEIISNILDFVLHIDKYLIKIVSDYRTWTYLIIFMVIFAETGFVVTPFLPGDSLLFAVGALIAKGETGLNIYIMGVLLIAAGISGNTINYIMGNFLGSKVFKPGNKILKIEYYDKTKEYFNKRGGNVLIFSRFMPIFRTMAPFVAGVGKMKFGQFTYYNIAGAILWIVSFLGIGFVFGNIPFIRDNFTYVMLVIIVLTILPAVIAAVRAKNSMSV
ncbi:VTT domain-containing protein [Daejeonella sp. H1SJ63]|jgi:membrane-associated protein|uniref:VTT domain-containing protein n=1 Tax=Daejeonella sp. H1SJ63 TaxID=3034145 RepID=UPI0023EB0663|nr:VTT domain-containing protein [Daejeonella sp. H1SJ63]